MSTVQDHMNLHEVGSQLSMEYSLVYMRLGSLVSTDHTSRQNVD
jgi:hypothetical protein